MTWTRRGWFVGFCSLVFVLPSQVFLAAQVTSPSAHDQLRKTVSVEFYDTPLSEAIAELSAQTTVPFVIDARSLDGIGLDVSEPLTFEYVLPLHEILDLSLSDLDLDYRVTDSTVVIAAAEAMENETRVYRLVDPAANGPRTDEAQGQTHRQAISELGDEVIGLVTETVSPDSWQAANGDGTARTFGPFLVVYQTPKVHREVVDLLTSVEMLDWKRGAPWVSAAEIRRSADAVDFGNAVAAESARGQRAGGSDPFTKNAEIFGNGDDSIEDNPFGGDDPFSGGSAEDVDDPFGAAESDDPFAQ